MYDEITTRVLADLPFSKIIAITPNNLEKIHIEGSDSGRVYFINGEERYKLRVCKDEEEAQAIERHVLTVPSAFPRFIGRDRSYILMEALDARMLTRDDILVHAKEIGVLCAKVNAHPGPDTDEEPRVIKHLAGIRDAGFMSSDVHDHALELFRRLKHHVPKHIRLDLDDLHNGNLMIDREGRIYYVDEESIDPRMQGMGLGKLLKLFHKEDWRQFLAGYALVEDSSIFTDEYILLIEFAEMTRIAEKKIRKGEDAADDLILIDDILLRMRPLIPMRG